MAKKKMMEMCPSHGCCEAWVGWVVLGAGVLWLLNDYNMAAWWQVSWWTLGALLVGLTVAMKKC